MGRPQRYISGPTLVELTTRTIQGRFLVKPGEECNRRVLGVLGRALELFPKVKLHGYVFLPNHYHLLATVPDAPTMSKFMCFLNTNTSKELGRLYDWEGPLWHRRYRGISVLDDESAVDRLRYILSNGVKEGLVASPSEWPGASCLATLLGEGPAKGVWYDRTALYRARKRNPQVTEADFEQEYLVELTPLPCWADETEAERQRRVRELVGLIEVEAAEEAERSGVEPLGAEQVLAQIPHARPRKVKRSPAPFVHAATKQARGAYEESYKRFAVRFLAATGTLRDRLVAAGVPVEAAAVVVPVSAPEPALALVA